MTYVIFENPGEIDITAIKTFGVSVKETSNPIGFFGTGLKYALAILLRENCKVSLYKGKETYTFTTNKTFVRDSEFSIIALNGDNLNFTTELGKTWTLMQAFRELYCNSIDENGSIYVSELTPKPEKNKTFIIVSGKAFVECFYKKSEMFLQTEPLYKTAYIEIHPGKSNYLYYRGVQAETLNNISNFTYNVISEMSLTEDRTLKNSWVAKSLITEGIALCENSSIIETCLYAHEDTFEATFNFHYVAPSNIFAEIAFSRYRKTPIGINKTIFNFLQRTNNIDFYVESKISSLEKKVLQKSIKFCEKLDFQVSKYPIIIVESLGNSILGLAKNNKIYLSKYTFSFGTKIVAGTILEEFIHLEYNLADETREMQNHLINTLISLGERITKSPL